MGSESLLPLMSLVVKHLWLELRVFNLFSSRFISRYNFFNIISKRHKYVVAVQEINLK